MRLMRSQKPQKGNNGEEANMSHFYASIQGSRGEATRQGTKNSGIYTHIRGWTTGVEVEILYNSRTSCDEVKVYRTEGSNGSYRELIAKWEEKA